MIRITYNVNHGIDVYSGVSSIWRGTQHMLPPLYTQFNEVSGVSGVSGQPCQRLYTESLTLQSKPNLHCVLFYDCSFQVEKEA